MSTLDSYSVLPTQRRFYFSLLSLPVVLGLSVAAVIVLLTVIYYLSIPQLLVVAVAGALLMALFYRISHIQSFAETCSSKNLDWSDGGAFGINEIRSAGNKQAQPVVYDGGSFERSSAADTHQY